ncbi:MAG: ubiquinol-cytochrome C chaperone family protein [Parasphingopyxis sp.]
MARLDRIFGDRRDRADLAPLYAVVVARARDPFWYREGGVPDTQDGRFDMIAAILSLVLLRLEQEGEARASEGALLAEQFIADMDGQLREIGLGDVVVGKHVGRMMGALGGRMAAYRVGLEPDGDLGAALDRNLYRGTPPPGAESEKVADRLQALHAALGRTDADSLIAGSLPEAA